MNWTYLPDLWVSTGMILLSVGAAWGSLRQRLKNLEDNSREARRAMEHRLDRLEEWRERWGS